MYAVVPPILFAAWRKIRSLVVVDSTYSSFLEAVKACGQTSYASSAIANFAVAKALLDKSRFEETGSLGTEAFPTGLSMAGSGADKKLRVIDFGGGGGNHYQIARAILGEGVNLRWNVVETPQMVAASRELADSSLGFFETIEDAAQSLDRVDLVFTSGALQYSPDPLLYLRKLMGLKAKTLFVTRMGLADSGGSAIFIQRSKLSRHFAKPLPRGFADEPTSYPITVVGKKQFESELRLVYDIRFWARDETEGYSISDRRFDMFTYLCHLR